MNQALNTLRQLSSEQAPNDALARLREMSSPKKPDDSVARNLLGGAREGFLEDTALQSVSTLVQATDTGSKLFNVAERYGVDEQRWKQLSTEERRVLISEKSREETRRTGSRDVDPEALSYKIGRAIGSVADLTSLIPLGGAAKLAKAKQLAAIGEKALATRMAGKGLGMMAGSGAGIGALDAAAWTAAQEGEVNPQTTLMGAGIGAVAPPALYGAVHGVKKGVGKALSIGTAKKEAAATIKALSEQKAIFRSSGMGEEEALVNALESLKMGAEDIGKLLAKSKKTLPAFGTKQEAADYVAMSRMGEDAGKVRTKGFRQEIRDTASYTFTPMDARLNELAPPIHLAHYEMARINKARLHTMDVKVDTHVIQDMKKLKKMGLYNNYKKIALTGTEKEQRAFISQHLGEEGIKHYNAYRSVSKELFDLQNSVRGPKNKFTAVDGYYPRWVKDVNGLRHKLIEKYGKAAGDDLDKLIAKKQRAKGSDLTEHERGKILADYVTARHIGKAKKTPGFSKKRHIVKVDDDLLPFYSDIEQSVHTNIRNSLDDYALRNILGRKIADKWGDSVESGVDEWLGSLADQNLIRVEDIYDIKSLLASRYLNATKGSGRATRVYKAIIHSSLLAQVGSVITQFEDLARTMYKFGVADTVKASLMKGNKFVSAREQGFIDALAEEYITTGLSQKITNTLFRITGFQAVDLMAKTAHQNAALLSAARKLSTQKGLVKFQQQWQPIFGGERYNKLVKDLQNLNKAKLLGKQVEVTPDMRTYAYMELAEMQPIDAMGMPQAFADNAKFRFMYTLRSFTIKQVDMWRRDVYGQFRKGNIREGIKNSIGIVGFLTAAGMTKDSIVNFMSGKDDPEFEQALFKNVLRATGVLDKHTITQLGGYGSDDPVTEFLKGFAPPMGPIGDVGEVGYKVAKDVFTDEDVEYDTTFWKYTPFLGRVLDNWIKGAE